jgi:predicted dehydrogenase
MEKWRLKEESGGLLWDALVHHIYLTEYFLGRVHSVYAIAKKVREQAFDSFTLVLQNRKKVSVCEFAWNVYEPLLEFQVLTEEGIRFHSDLIHDFLLKRKRPYRAREVEAIRSFTDDLYIPLIKWAGHLQKLLEIRSYPGAFPFKRTFPKLIKQLISYLKGASTSPPITAENGLRTIRVLEAAEKSIKTMRVQSLPK